MSKICKNCGAKLEDDASFCFKCKHDPDKVWSKESEEKELKKEKKGKAIIVISVIVIAALIGGLIFLIVSCNRRGPEVVLQQAFKYAKEENRDGMEKITYHSIAVKKVPIGDSGMYAYYYSDMDYTDLPGKIERNYFGAPWLYEEPEGREALKNCTMEIISKEEVDEKDFNKILRKLANEAGCEENFNTAKIRSKNGAIDKAYKITYKITFDDLGSYTDTCYAIYTQKKDQWFIDSFILTTPEDFEANKSSY